MIVFTIEEKYRKSKSAVDWNHCIRFLMYHWYTNKILTFICNLFTNLNLTDMETGYKVFKTSALKSVNLKEKSFSFEPEVTIKLAKKNYKFFKLDINDKYLPDGSNVKLDALTINHGVLIRTNYDE